MKSLYLLLSVLLLVGCITPTSTNTKPSASTTISLKATIPASSKLLALSSGSVGGSGARSARALSGTDSGNLVAVDSSGAVSSVLDYGLVLSAYSIPPGLTPSSAPLIISGNFDAPTTDGGTVHTNVIWVDPSTNSATPLYTLQVGDSSTIPVATTREGSLDVFTSTTPHGYWVVNKIGGGYSVHRFDGVNSTVVLTEATGQVTDIVVGTKSIFGWDGTTKGGAAFFGNPNYGYVSVSQNDYPTFYKGFVFYNITAPVSGGPMSLFYNLDAAVSTTFGALYSVTANSPATASEYTQYSVGAFWIDDVSKHLYEVFDIDDLNPIGFRSIDTGTWASVVASNNVLVGIVDKGAGNILTINTLALNLNTLGSVRTLDLTNRLSAVDLDTVTSLSLYASGVSITGTKGGTATTRYWNTTTGAVESAPASSASLSNVSYIQ